MELNHLPKADQTKNETGCCPRFDPARWEGQELHFKKKIFARAKTLSLFHVPLNMGSTFAATMKAIEEAGALDEEFAVLSRDLSPWRAEHLFAVTRAVPGLESVTLSGDFVAHVFEGPFSEMETWSKELAAFAASKGRSVERQYFFYTTCPKCTKHYGKNYVVGIAQVSARETAALAA